MVVIERAGSSSSLSTCSRKEKQSRSSEKDSNEVTKKERKLIRKTSSISTPPSTPSKKEKKSGSCLKDSHEVAKGKFAPRANSFSSPSSPCKRKGNENMSGQKDIKNEPAKVKLVRKASSLSSSSNSSTKREPVKRLSTSNVSEKSRSNTLIKSRIKELGPICKRRKEILSSIKLEEDIDVYLDKQIEDEGKGNPEDCLWLTSGSMSPQEFGLFMSALDPCLDEWVLSFLPRSSRTPNAFDGSKAIITPVCETNLLLRGVEKEEVTHEANGSALARSQSINSSCSSSLALSTSNNSSFWNMDRTGVWVSLINLDGEDSKFISDVDSRVDELESNFPSPNYESNWDSYFSDVGVSSSAKSTTQESASQSEWSSDLLSDSMDWEMESDDPIFWPYGVDCDWDQKNLDSFSVSPRKGIYKIRFNSGEDSSVTPDSIRFRLQGRNGKRIVFMSGLSASKIIDFKKKCRKNAATAATAAAAARGKRCSKTGKRANRFKKRVPPILEDDLEGISPKESLNKGANSSDMDLSECTDDWGDEMDDDAPLFWPTDHKTAHWDVTWENFNISPRKHSQLNTDLSSPKAGFAISSSVRLKFCPKKVKSKAVPSTKSSLGTSKSFKFKSISQKTKVAAGDKSLVVIVPGKRRSMFKSTNMFFKHGSHGKKKRDMPLKVGKSVEEFIRLVSIIGMNNMFPGNELAPENLPIETLVGLGEFDGHEGVDMEFQDDDFSLEECTRG